MISFIIPCYNEEDYIRDCIESIKKAASNIDYEIIVVDNNCTDNTSDIARNEGVIVLTEERKGVVFARQTGYENAKYDLIANIDADSRLPEYWVNIALKNIQPENVAAVTGPLVYDDGSVWLRIATRFYYYIAYISNLFVGVFLQGGNCLIKKKYLDELNGYDTSIAFYGEDTMTAKRLYEYGKIKLVMNLNLYSSSRRLQKQGVFKTTWLYLINYLYVTFRNKSYSNDYKDFR
jgi:glycosyltransferase involved in cell wall biosynthesis